MASLLKFRCLIVQNSLTGEFVALAMADLIRLEGFERWTPDELKRERGKDV